MGRTAAIPAHLRRLVVDQDYGHYTAVDRAVWRFLLLHTRARLADTAHPAYRNGHEAAGISPDRIPRIAEMNDRLARFGWGAVCVDGFIPPRVFQEFQASGLLPIAAALRTREHLAYTPAPDLFHEAAGHTPILPDPIFASYLRRIGDLGRKAFANPEEAVLDEAIHVLSERKENPSLGPEEIARAEAALEAVIERLPEPSEAARLARLYWWTAEYGLVGRLNNYKIYGAGLLSSLGESHSCHAPEVAKLLLDERCMDVAYDITRPQPQLFVAASFEALHDVLDRAAREMAINIGGLTALRRAIRSRELATVRFSAGAGVIGVLIGAGPRLDQPSWLEFSGRVGYVWHDELQPEHERLEGGAGAVVVLGTLANGSRLEQATDHAIEAARDRISGRHEFRFASGAELSGLLQHVVRDSDGRLMRLELTDAEVRLAGDLPRRYARHVLLPAGDVVTAHAGAVDVRFHPDTEFPRVSPDRRRPLARERRSISLYQRAAVAQQDGVAAIQREFPRILAAQRSSENRDPSAATAGANVDWLLRWLLLEGIVKTGKAGWLAQDIRQELERLEIDLDDSFLREAS